MMVQLHCMEMHLQQNLARVQARLCFRIATPFRLKFHCCKKTERITMKLLPAFVGLFVSAHSIFAQGTIDFINRNISTRADPLVLYSVPIYDARQGGRAAGAGAGNAPGGVTLGLFLVGAPDDATPIISTMLRTGTSVQAQFLVSGVNIPTTATIPGVAAGSTANLMVRLWQGSSFAAARRNGIFGGWGEWTFTSAPLGGTPPTGLPIPTPGMTGWGPENGAGFEVWLIPEPSAVALSALGIGALFLRRRNG
jgi:hypothetical protein